MRGLPIANFQLSIVFALLGAMHGMSGCGTSGKTEENVSDVGVTRTAGQGPVKLTLTVRPKEPAFNERAEVVVEVVADKGVTVDVADYERSESLAEHQFEFRVTPVDRKAATPTDDGKLKWTYRYAVEFFLPGPYEFPPAVVSFVDSREASDSATPAQAHELKTESLKIVARDTRPLTPEELKTITALPPVELSEPWSRWWWAAPPLLATLVTLLVALVRRSRRMNQVLVVAQDAAKGQGAFVARGPVGPAPVKHASQVRLGQKAAHDLRQLVSGSRGAPLVCKARHRAPGG